MHRAVTISTQRVRALLTASSALKGAQLSTDLSTAPSLLLSLSTSLSLPLLLAAAGSAAPNPALAGVSDTHTEAVVLDRSPFFLDVVVKRLPEVAARAPAVYPALHCSATRSQSQHGWAEKTSPQRTLQLCC